MGVWLGVEHVSGSGECKVWLGMLRVGGACGEWGVCSLVLFLL